MTWKKVYRPPVLTHVCEIGGVMLRITGRTVGALPKLEIIKNRQVVRTVNCVSVQEAKKLAPRVM
jgi:hypothetical protein